MAVYAIVGDRSFGDVERLTKRGGKSYGETRAASDREYFVKVVSSHEGGIEKIVSGGATGADTLAKWYAGKYGIPFEEFPANWDRFGRAAGPMRNKQIVEAADIMIAFMAKRSKGTRNAVDQMIKAGKPIHIYPVARDGIS